MLQEIVPLLEKSAYSSFYFRKAANEKTFLCGIHSVNAFFKVEVIKEYDPEYIQFMLQRLEDPNRNLNSIEKKIKAERLDTHKLCEWSYIEDLVDYMKLLAKKGLVSSEFETVDYREIVIESADNIAQQIIPQLSKVFQADRFILLYGSHYVTFVKDNKSWILLDDHKEKPEVLTHTIEQELINLMEQGGENQERIFGDIAIIAEKAFLN